MATYKNQEGENSVVAKAHIKITPATYKVYTQYGMTSYHYRPYVYVSPFGGDINYISGEGYCYSSGSGTLLPPTIFAYGTEYTFEVKGNSAYRELVTPSIRGGDLVPSDWRTKIKALPKSNMEFTYVLNNAYDFICNGVKLGNVSSGYVSSPMIGASGESTYIAGEFTPHTEGSKLWKIEIESSAWAWNKYEYTITNPNTDEYINFIATGHSLTVEGVFEARRDNSWTTLIGASNIGRASFQYKIDSDCIPPLVNTSQLHFSSSDTVYDYDTQQWKQLEWYGLQSPKINYSLTGDYLQVYVGSQYRIDATPQFTDISRKEWRIPYTQFPSSIGNVTLLNPELINPNYYEHIDERTGEVEIVRNNILKLVPDLEGTDNMSVVFKPKPICNVDNLVANNCEVYQNPLDLKYKYIRNVSDNATLILDNIAHPQYEDESGETPPEYRQKHFTKARYLQLDITEKCVREIEGETITEYIPTHKVKLDLYCKPYGDISEKKWEYCVNGVAYNSEEQLYNIPLIDLTRQCNFTGDRFDSGDEYEKTYNVENYKIYEEAEEEGQENSVYREESPSYSDTITPNLVGKLIIKLEKGKEYRIGDIKSFIAPYNYISSDTDKSPYNLVKDEFRDLFYVGDHNPHSEEEQDKNHPFYLDRYVKGIVNGKSSYEIPQIQMEQMPVYDIDLYTPLTLNSLYCDTAFICPSCLYEFSYLNSEGVCPNCGETIELTEDIEKELGGRMIYPRDDLGEISFNIQEYEPDDDGYYDINAIYNGTNSYVSFLRENKGSEELHTIENIGIKSEPRVDTLSGEKLYRYLNRLKEPIRVVGDFGGYVSGISSVRDVDIMAMNQSKYNTVSDWYNGKHIGRDWYLEKIEDTQIKNYNNNHTREITNVYDGLKYTFSHIWNRYDLICDREGKLLYDRWGRLLYGLGKRKTDDEDNQ